MAVQHSMESIRRQISEGEIKAALDELRAVYQANGQRTIDVDIQKGKLSDINQDRRNGIVSNEDYKNEINRIRVSSLELVDEIEEIITSNNLAQNEAVNQIGGDSFFSPEQVEEEVIETPKERLTGTGQHVSPDRSPEPEIDERATPPAVIEDTHPPRGIVPPLPKTLISRIIRGVSVKVFVVVMAILVLLGGYTLVRPSKSSSEMEILKMLGLHHVVLLTYKSDGSCEIPDFFDLGKIDDCVEFSHNDIPELQKFKEFLAKNNIHDSDPLSQGQLLKFFKTDLLPEDDLLVLNFCFDGSGFSNPDGLMFSINKEYCDSTQFGIKRSDWHRFQNLGQKDPVFLYKKKLTTNCIKFYAYFK